MTSITNVGAMISSLLAGWFIKYGKTKMLLLCDLLVIVSTTICLFDGWILICVGRFMLGLAVGSFTVFVPKFINETAPTEFKGPLGAMSQFMTTLGIVIPAALCLNLPSSREELEMLNQE